LVGVAIHIEAGVSLAQEVDAYWLQRRIAAACSDLDAAAAQARAEEVLQRLQARPAAPPEAPRARDGTRGKAQA